MILFLPLIVWNLLKNVERKVFLKLIVQVTEVNELNWKPKHFIFMILQSSLYKKLEPSVVWGLLEAT